MFAPIARSTRNSLTFRSTFTSLAKSQHKTFNTIKTKQNIASTSTIHDKLSLFERKPLGIRALSTSPNNDGDKSKYLRRFGAAGSAIALLASKSKFVFGALKLTKFSTLASMLLTTGAYSMFFGLPYAAGMVGLILVHESGHALAMRAYGIPSGPMVFIPFMGASVAMKDRPKDVYQEAMIALAGPVLGSAAAIGVMGAGITTGNQLLIALADFGLMINLFNLMPIGQLDGGRIGGALSPWFLVAGLAGGAAMIYDGQITNPLFYLIMLMGTFNTYERFRDGSHWTYYRLSGAQRVGLSAGYFGLIALLLAAMAYNRKYKMSPKQLAQMQREQEGVESDIMVPGSLAYKMQALADEFDEPAYDSGLPTDFFYEPEKRNDDDWTSGRPR